MNFEYDLFISYTHIDNQPLSKEQDGWISTLHTALKIRLSQLQGRKSKIWRDKKLQGNDRLSDTIIEALNKSGVLVSILSPCYLESKWCMWELDHFCQTTAPKTGGLRVGDNKTRLFKVIKTDVSSEQHPPPFESLLGYDFFEFDEAGRPQEFNKIYGPELERKFYAKLNDLAYDIHKTLQLLESQPKDEALEGNVVALSKTIYLAETVDELMDARDKIRRELTMSGHQVLPAQPLSFTPTDFTQQVQENLARCNLSIHLVSPQGNEAGDASPSSMTKRRKKQAQRSREQIEIVHRYCQENKTLDQIVWMPPSSIIGEEDTFLKNLQRQENCLSTPLESLKIEIQERLNPKKDSPTLEASANGMQRVYLDCAQRDLESEDLEPLYNWLKQRYQVILPDYEASNLQKSEASLKQCEAVLIYYGQASELWLKRRMYAIKKTFYDRPQELLAQAVYMTGPATPNKQNFTVAEMLVINGLGGFNPGLLTPFVTSLSTQQANACSNPFPGLRPFVLDEEHLFFGREGQADELLERLNRTRFLGVVGTSGSGKSSLVRAGLLPSLYSGFLSDANSGWQVAVLCPGGSPIRNLAKALNKTEVFGGDDAIIRTALTESTLRRGTLGLVEVTQQARMADDENLLVVVDQFEELFRFKQQAQSLEAEDEAAAFVKLLLAAFQQREVPIFIVITMRSDFLGDCAQFQGLPEVLNDSQYLIPRLTRHQMRRAIEGPVAVGGATITPQLVNRLLNDVGDNPDQLPILQHALMRTWDHWKEQEIPQTPLDISHYETVGGIAEALSRHVDQIYEGLEEEPSHQKIAEILFRCLTDRGADNREIRRPTQLQEICAVADAKPEEVVEVIEHFRTPHCSFLTPPIPRILQENTVIDISHESLIRNWQRLHEWVLDESNSAGIYKRLAETAELHAQGKAGYFRSPDLTIALDWQEKNQPKAAWAKRYALNFEEAISFLQDSLKEENRANQENISSFLQGKSALEIIQYFDSEFDIPFKQGLCIGLLEMLEVYNLTELDNIQTLAEYVGAWWCRIISADVSYDILAGLEAIRVSKNEATTLYQSVLEKTFSSENSDEETQMIAYVAARWHDGAAKIQYRCNDHTEARILFQKAKQITEHAHLWYCLPDIQSNYLRAEYEELRVVGYAIDLKTQYQELLDQYREPLEQKLATARQYQNLSTAKSAPKHYYQEREFLRGLASIFHNLSIELKKNKETLDTSQRASEKSEEISRILDDKYRLAHALNHQAQLALKQKKLKETRNYFGEIINLPWRRGQLIAEQNLAKIDAEEGIYDKSLERIKKILDQIQVINQQIGGNPGFDSDFHYFTVHAFKLILRLAINSGELTPDRLQQYRTRLSEEQLQMVRSIHKVVKITTYKAAFSKRFYPIYLELIADCLQQLSPHNVSNAPTNATDLKERAFALIEEASSRELLDLLQNNVLPDMTLIHPNSPHVVYENAIPKKYFRPSQGSWSKTQSIEPKINEEEEILSLLNQRQRQYEDYSLMQPITITESNPDIAYEVRMFTADHPKLIIVRYFFYRPETSRQLAAYVFRDGDMHVKILNWQKVEKELIHLWDKTWGSNEEIISTEVKQLSELISSLLIEPLWNSITGGNSLDEHHHLVLIPSEELFKLPLHIACVPGENMPLATHVPLSFSVSSTAYVTRNRHLQRCQRVKKYDDLCVLIQPDESISGKEIVGLTWPAKAFHIAGQRPVDLKAEHQHHGQANRQGLSKLIEQKPDFFIYAGYSLYQEAFKSVGPVLALEDDCLTQFDIAMGVRLPRNKLTILGASVSGQGVNFGGGEVAGFIRAFIAAGCGALGVTLWPVLDDAIAETTRHLLTAAQSAANSNQQFDVVQEAYQYYRAKCEKLGSLADRVEACPLALYL